MSRTTMQEDEDSVISATERWWDDPESALERLRAFLRIMPGSIRVRLRVASILATSSEDLENAEKLYREILVDDPRNVTALSRLGLLSGHPGSTVTPDESLQLLTKAAELSGEPWAWENLANKAWDYCRLEEALAAYTTLSSLAKSKGLRRLVNSAEKAIKAIQGGQTKSEITGYSAPDI